MTREPDGLMWVYCEVTGCDKTAKLTDNPSPNLCWEHSLCLPDKRTDVVFSVAGHSWRLSTIPAPVHFGVNDVAKIFRLPLGMAVNSTTAENEAYRNLEAVEQVEFFIKLRHAIEILQVKP